MDGVSILTFLCQGGTVICADLKKPNDQLVKSLGEQSKGLHCYEADVTEPESIKSLFGEIARTFGKVDILANNAGIIYKEHIEDMDLNQWNNLLKVNLTGLMLMNEGNSSIYEKTEVGQNNQLIVDSGIYWNKSLQRIFSFKAGVLGLLKFGPRSWLI